MAAVRAPGATAGRIGMERTMRAGVWVGFGLGRRRVRLLLPLRGRNAGIVRCLWRQAERGLQFREPRRQGGDLSHQRRDQRIFLCVREVRKVGSSGHGPKDSDSSPARAPDPKNPSGQFATVVKRPEQLPEYCHAGRDKRGPASFRLGLIQDPNKLVPRCSVWVARAKPAA